MLTLVEKDLDRSAFVNNFRNDTESEINVDDTISKKLESIIKDLNSAGFITKYGQNKLVIAAPTNYLERFNGGISATSVGDSDQIICTYELRDSRNKVISNFTKKTPDILASNNDINSDVIDNIVSDIIVNLPLVKLHNNLKILTEAELLKSLRDFLTNYAQQKSAKKSNKNILKAFESDLLAKCKEKISKVEINSSIDENKKQVLINILNPNKSNILYVVQVEEINKKLFIKNMWDCLNDKVVDSNVNGDAKKFFDSLGKLLGIKLTYVPKKEASKSNNSNNAENKENSNDNSQNNPEQEPSNNNENTKGFNKYFTTGKDSFNGLSANVKGVFENLKKSLTEAIPKFNHVEQVTLDKFEQAWKVANNISDKQNLIKLLLMNELQIDEDKVKGLGIFDINNKAFKDIYSSINDANGDIQNTDNNILAYICLAKKYNNTDPSPKTFIITNFIEPNESIIDKAFSNPDESETVKLLLNSKFTQYVQDTPDLANKLFKQVGDLNTGIDNITIKLNDSIIKKLIQKTGYADINKDNVKHTLIYTPDGDIWGYNKTKNLLSAIGADNKVKSDMTISSELNNKDNDEIIKEVRKSIQNKKDGKLISKVNTYLNKSKNLKKPDDLSEFWTALLHNAITKNLKIEVNGVEIDLSDLE